MTFKQAIKQIIKGEKPLIDVWHYLVGNYRYFFWYWNLNCKYSKLFKWLQHIPMYKVLRLHIRQQIMYRLAWMNRECYVNGECVKCGCNTTHLQMCNKSCEGLCYPSMMSKGEWEYYKAGGTFKDEHGVWTPELSKNNEPVLL